MELENQQEKVSKLKNQVDEQRIKINELIYQNSNTLDVESRYRNMATHFEILENQVETLRQEAESWRQKFVNSDKELFLSTEKLKITESVKQERDKLLYRVHELEASMPEVTESRAETSRLENLLKLREESFQKLEKNQVDLTLTFNQEKTLLKAENLELKSTLEGLKTEKHEHDISIANQRLEIEKLTQEINR